MTTYHDIEAKAEEAIAAYLSKDVATIALGITITPGLFFDDFMGTEAQGDGVYVTCDEATPAGQDGGGIGVQGNWDAKVTVGVFTQKRKANTTAAALKTLHRNRTNTVRDAVMGDDLNNIASAQHNDFTAFGYSINSFSTKRTEHHVISICTFTLNCCGQKIPIE